MKLREQGVDASTLFAEVGLHVPDVGPATRKTAVTDSKHSEYHDAIKPEEDEEKEEET